MLALDNVEKGLLLKETTVVSSISSASDHLQLLLLLCGDIELNPGPSETEATYLTLI